MKKHLIKKFFRRIFRIAWWRPDKDSKKMLRKEADKLIGCDKRPNPIWAKSWKYFIKRQYPWSDLIKLIQFKIIEMRNYTQNHVLLTPKEVEKQIKEMTEIIELGNKILANEYGNIWHKWFKENTVPVTYVYLRNKENDDLSNLKEEPITTIYGEGIFDDCMLKIDSKPGKTQLEQWLEDHGLSRKDVILAYSSEWHNDKTQEENDKESSELLKQWEQDRQADISKYFECIGEYYYNWGD